MRNIKARLKKLNPNLSAADKVYLWGLLTGACLVGVGAVTVYRAQQQVISDIGSYLKLTNPELHQDMVDFLAEKYRHHI